MQGPTTAAAARVLPRYELPLLLLLLLLLLFLLLLELVVLLQHARTDYFLPNTKTRLSQRRVALSLDVFVCLGEGKREIGTIYGLVLLYTCVYIICVNY